MIKEKELDKFVEELTFKGVEYDTKTKEHWRGYKNLGKKKDVISNKGMKIMCEGFFGTDYVLSSDSTQRKIRERVFRKLRQFHIKRDIKHLRGEQNV